MRRLIAILFVSFLPLVSHARPFVEADLLGQLGNQMFEIATACAVAWDNDADPCFPDLGKGNLDIPVNRAHVFFRCNPSSPRWVSYVWKEPSHAYHPIPFVPDMRLFGYYQTEKYFVHHRERILDLFAPHPDDWNYIQNKFDWLLQHPYTVAVHIRVVWEDPVGKLYIQYGKDFLRKAMAMFPEEALFVIISNNHQFARENIPEEFLDRVVHIEGEPHYIDFYLLTVCKHNIFTPSTFGWWGAWMNRNPDKIVITGSEWFTPGYPLNTSDIVPKSWKRIDAKYGPLNNPASYQ